jgi:hypothetical protein
MIVCDDYFLNDESTLKTMLRIFEKRITRTSRLKSISWVVSSFSFRREARDVYVCVCVLCSKKMRIKNVVCEKNLFFVEFKDFCFLRSILELIVRSLVNIKREERSLLRWRNSNIFYFILFFRHFFIQSYLNFSCYFFFETLWELRLASSKWSLLIFFLLSRIMFMNRRWSSKHAKKWSKSRDIWFKESLRTTWLKDKMWWMNDWNKYDRE